MKFGAFSISVFAASCLATGVYAQTTQRTSTVILAEYDAVQPPKLDAAEAQAHPEVAKAYYKDLQASMAKKASLAQELISTAPDDPRVAEVAAARWEYLGAHDADALIAEVRQIRTSGEPKALVEAAGIAEANALLLRANRGTDDEKLKQLKAIIDTFGNTPAAEVAAGKINQITGIGKPFPIDFKDAITGASITSESLKGKIVVIDYWATWCGPCVAEMPKLKTLYERYKDQGVQFIGVSLDKPETEGGLTRLKTFVEVNQIPWPQCYDGLMGKSPLVQHWGVDFVPAAFVLDKRGNLVTTKARGKLEELLPKLLAEGG